MVKLIRISELAKELKLIDPKSKKPLNHIIRFWEKEFSAINPKIINKRRYYSKNQVEKIKMIKFFLKDKGMTVKGVKNLLKSDINKLDENNSISLKADYFKEKSLKILKKIKKLKRYSKKNSY